MTRPDCGRQLTCAFIPFSGLAHYRTHENKNEHQDNDQENIINSVLLSGCDTGAGNIFTCDGHVTYAFQYACHDCQLKSARQEMFLFIPMGRNVSLYQNTPV